MPFYSILLIFLNINILIKYSFGWELNNFPFILPPVIKLFFIVFSVFFNISSSNTPNSCKYKYIFKTYEIIFVKNIFKQLANLHYYTYLYLWNSMLECFCTIEQSYWNVFIKFFFQIGFHLLITFHLAYPRFNVSFPLISS